MDRLATDAEVGIDAVESIDLEAYRHAQRLTWQQLADRIGAKSAGQALA